MSAQGARPRPQRSRSAEAEEAAVMSDAPPARLPRCEGYSPYSLLQWAAFLYTSNKHPPSAWLPMLGLRSCVLGLWLISHRNHEEHPIKSSWAFEGHLLPRGKGVENVYSTSVAPGVPCIAQDGAPPAHGLCGQPQGLVRRRGRGRGSQSWRGDAAGAAGDAAGGGRDDADAAAAAAGRVPVRVADADDRRDGARRRAARGRAADALRRQRGRRRGARRRVAAPHPVPGFRDLGFVGVMSRSAVPRTLSRIL